MISNLLKNDKEVSGTITILNLNAPNNIVSKHIKQNGQKIERRNKQSLNHRTEETLPFPITTGQVNNMAVGCGGPITEQQPWPN